MLVRLLLVMVLTLSLMFASCICPKKEEIPTETPTVEEETEAPEEPTTEAPLPGTPTAEEAPEEAPAGE